MNTRQQEGCTHATVGETRERTTDTAKRFVQGLRPRATLPAFAGGLL